GFFSPAEARPAMGFLMLGAATIIYGIGPGTQEVMSALFGPWWPTIQNMFASITEPIGEAFGGFANTLRSGWLMLTDPVGYATQLMNGTHAANPIGKTGSLGVEITDITISSILPAQPYVITAMIKNEGAFDAENVTVFLSTDYEGADKVRAKGPSKWWGPLLLVKKAWERDILQFRDIFGMDQPFNCWENVSPSEDKCENELTRQNIWQIVFTSETGVSCDVIGYYKLREKAIPLKVAVTYNYSSDSEVDIEFISKNEWQRLAEANQLNQKLRIIQSQYSTAPVEFPIGTPGLKNPILVGQDFHIGMRIEASGTKGSIEHVESVVLEYPSVFVRKGDCTPEGKEEPSGNPDITRMVWRDRSGGSMVVYCPFKGLDPEKLTGPTKTYVVSAHANYTFTKWREKDTRIEFGGKCCDKDDCLQGQECVDGMCVSEGAVGLECDFEPNTRMEFREIPKYKTEIETAVRTNNLASHTDSSYAAEALVAAIIERESSWNPGSKTHEENVNDHSFGLMQIRFETARGLGFPFKDLDTPDNYPCNTNDPSNLCYPARNIDYGTKYLAQRLERATSLRCAISNYNAGSGCPLTKNKDNCNYVKNVLENYYKYYFFYDYCGWREKQNLGKCTLGMGGCTGTTQCDQSVVYGPDDGDKKAPICRTDLKPKVCCPPSDIFDTNKCQNAFTTWKSQG
ncbi:MAG: lytic transglycosylase domain-containing protein, partial [Candidatus Aenigmatarchaeota archaeon]